MHSRSRQKKLKSIDYQSFDLGNGIYRVGIKDVPKPKVISSTKKFVPFHPELAFAGITKDGNPLSIPDSKGPAMFYGLPLKIVRKLDASTLIYAVGCLFKTPNPDLIAVYANNLIHICAGNPNQLLERCEQIDQEIFITYSNPQFNISTCDESTALTFHATVPTSKLFFSGHHQRINVGIPPSTGLSREQWKLLGKHVVVESNEIKATDTVSVVKETWGYPLNLKGETIADIENEYGITIVPLNYCLGNLSFFEFSILDQVKASKLGPCYGYLKGKTIRQLGYSLLSEVNDSMFLLSDLIMNQRLLKQLRVLFIYDSKYVCIPFIDSYYDDIDYPIQKFNPCTKQPHLISEIYCPKVLIPQFYISKSSAEKKYRLKSTDLVSIKTTRNPQHWVPIDKLDRLPLRNRASERKTKLLRKQILQAIHGTPPEIFTGFPKANIAKYYDIQSKIESGILTPIADISNLLPKARFRSKFIKWLLSNNQITICPITKRKYVTNFKSMDDMANIPGFWDLLKSNFVVDSKWFSLLVTSNAVKSFAILEAI